MLLTAIDELTHDLRERLGESLDSIARTDPPFTQYTTSSLEALELARARARAPRAGGVREGGALATAEALQHDPKLRRRPRLARPPPHPVPRPARRGQGRAGARPPGLGRDVEAGAPPHRALNKQFVAGDLPGALEDNRFISELYPDMMQPYNNSGRILQALGRFPEAAGDVRAGPREGPERHRPPLERLLPPRRAGSGTRRGPSAWPAPSSPCSPTTRNAAHTLAWSFVMQRRFAGGRGGHARDPEARPENPYALPEPRPPAAAAGRRRGGGAGYRRLGQARPEARQRARTTTRCASGSPSAPPDSEAEAGRVMQRGGQGDARRAGRRSRLDPIDEATLAALLAVAGRHGRGSSPPGAGGEARGAEGRPPPPGSPARTRPRARPTGPPPSTSAPSSRATATPTTS